jgi:hypothetical protein
MNKKPNNLLQRTVKSVTIFAMQKYAPLLPAAELGVIFQNSIIAALYQLYHAKACFK